MSTYPFFDLSLRLAGLPEFSELTCVDFGCGAYNSDVARTVLEIPWKKLVSIDGYQPDLDAAGAKPCAAKEWERVLGDVKTIKTEAFDVVLSFDVLEHMTHEDGEKWLEKLEGIAKKRIVLFAPIEPDGFHRPWTADNNTLQEHLSHWKPHELQARGFDVQVITGCHSDKKEDGSTITFDAMWAIKNKE